MTERVHHSLLVIDTHVDIPWPNGADFLTDGPRCVDLPKLRRGGVGAVCFAAYVPQGKRDASGDAEARARALGMLDTIAHMGAEEGTVLARDADAIEQAHLAGRIAVIPAVENGTALGGDLASLDDFAARGVRYMTLTHNGHNALADSAIPRRDLGDAEAEHGGLSALGRAAIGRMNDLGILADVSHAAKSTMMQAAVLSRTPIVATHSCARALCDHPRNLDDEQLIALRDTGGVIQITMVSAFLKPGAKPSDVGVFTVADHVDYVAERIGIDHVGIGTDFDGGGGVDGYMHAGQTPALTAELVSRGYDGAALGKIWGGNFLRVLRAAEAARK
ncbi:dipeptidase [Acidiphilium sp. AL]|uniref:Dipeptidase n=1 Tax=Acidiphilium iwatense TaxID=768198 RepID=A0ABS9DXJ0_9PROT|nr:MULTISPECIES: dipeptidase [Acidiphilium]MCF3946848.1 dipeptidase [Acidiphilium iwatense]MCU4161033.1 dipeptidase [Acidiphilium sp. AL]